MDTLRLLFTTRESCIERVGEIAEGWRVGSYAWLGQTWAEGHPKAGGLASPQEVAEAAERVRAEVDERFGVMKDLGVARLDTTTTRPYDEPGRARAFLSGMAALELPRCEASRRGTPVHSVSWTHATGRRILARCYDKGLERGGEAFRSVRLEDQRRFKDGRPPADVAASAEFQRDRFVSRFGPMRKAVDGVRAATFPVIAQAIADEVKYGYRDPREAERMAGALVLLSGGAGEAYKRSTYYNRRAELRAAGFVVVPDFMEPVEVDLGDELDAALAEFGS